MCNFLGVKRSLLSITKITTSKVKKAKAKVDCGETLKLLNLK
jgi:hypothetical protein